MIEEQALQDDKNKSETALCTWCCDHNRNGMNSLFASKMIFT